MKRLKFHDRLVHEKIWKRNKKLPEQDFQRGWTAVKRYVTGRDIPDWFRGTSAFQTSAISNLYEALLFDIEQHTCHRVKRVLNEIGLKPMVATKEIKFTMKLSQGSDLAFLWFLLERYYATPESSYTVNEQLIMSAIAHLDMVTTLRELDRILPRNPVIPKKVPKKPVMRVVVKSKNFKKHNTPKNSTSPYYQTLKSPTVQPNNLSCQRPDLKVGMGEYEVYANPNYIVKNESNRWFAYYEPRPSVRVVHNILNDEINRIFDEHEAIAEKVKHGRIVCEYHKRLKEAEDRMHKELESIARQRCREYFDVETKKKERTRQRILEQIETDVEMFRLRMQNSKEHRFDCKKNGKKDVIEVVTGDDTVEYVEGQQSSQEVCQELENYEFDGENCADEPRPSNRSSIKEPKNLHANWECGGTDDSEDSEESYKLFTNSVNFSQLINCDVTCHTLKGSSRAAARSSKLATKCDNVDDTLPASPSKQFFFASREHQPWFFEFHKIFDICHPYTPETVNIEQEFAVALDSEMSLATRYRGKLHPEIDKALNKGFKRDWSKAVEQYNIDNDPPICPELMRQEQIKLDGEEVPLKFDRETFNPDDHKYMRYMLKRAFEFMKRKKKFVLATLPDAHKLPAFFYFIQNRFGKTYSYAERTRLYRETLQVLRHLEKLTKRVPMPKIESFGTNPFISYACRDYLIAKGDKIRQKYYEELDSIIMEQTRVFWFAIRPYLCSSGPPRNTFFAYMPSRSVDITRFRQWKSSEFMDAKKEWNRRQRERRNAIY